MPNKPLPENPKWGDKLNPEWASWQEGQQATLKWVIEWLKTHLWFEDGNGVAHYIIPGKELAELKALEKE